MNPGLRSTAARWWKILKPTGRRAVWTEAAWSQREQPGAGMPALLRLARAQNAQPPRPADY